MGEIIRTRWFMDSIKVETVDGPDLAAVAAVEGYSMEELVSSSDQMAVLRMTVTPEVFAPFIFLSLWPDFTAADPDLLDMGEFASKPPFVFEFNLQRLVWRHIPHPTLNLPIR